MDYEISFEEDPAAADLGVLADGLHRFVEDLFPGNRVGKANFFIRDRAGKIVGGVAGNYGTFGWMYVDLLWIDDRSRGQGYGRRLMELIEAEAIRHDCRNIY